LGNGLDPPQGAHVAMLLKETGRAGSGT
jgi:hypothetical protein